MSTTCLNGWNSTLQAAWYIRHVRVIRILWTKPTIWLSKLSFTQSIVRACSMFYHEGYRSVTPLDAARVNRTIFHNHSVHWYYITLRVCLNFISSASERLERLERNISWLVVVKKGIKQIPSVPTMSVFFGRGSGSVKTVIVVQRTERSDRTGT